MLNYKPMLCRSNTAKLKCAELTAGDPERKKEEVGPNGVGFLEVWSEF